MRKPLLFVLLLVSAAWSAQRFGVLPFQDRVEDLGGRVRDVGGEYLGVGFTTVCGISGVRDGDGRWRCGDMEVVGQLAAGQIATAQASQTYLGLRRFVRDVHQVAYRLEAEDPAPDGKRVTLSVSQALTIDPVGTSSSFGTVACQGKYAWRRWPRPPQVGRSRRSASSCQPAVRSGRSWSSGIALPLPSGRAPRASGRRLGLPS